MDVFVGVVPFVESLVQVAVDEVEGIDGLQQLVLLPILELSDVCLGGVEEDALEEVGVPVELHLDEEGCAGGVGAVHIDDAVFSGWCFRHQLGRQIAEVGDGPSLFQREEGVEQAGGQVDVFSENFPEGDVCHGAIIFTWFEHNNSFFYGAKIQQDFALVKTF